MSLKTKLINLIIGGVTIITFLGSGLTLQTNVTYPGEELTHPRQQPAAPQATKDNHYPLPIDVIRNLAGDAMQGREAGTIGETKAAAYIINQMRRLGLQPYSDRGYELVFTVPKLEKTQLNDRVIFVQTNKSGWRSPAANLLGVWPGQKPDEIILLSAHYDHLGLYHNEIYAGANDNASGVSTILEVIRRLKQENTKFHSTIVVAFWSGEEMGFLGSRAFVANPPFALSQIKAMVNVDTVGNGSLGEFAYWAADNNLAVQALRAASRSAGASLVRARQNGHNSDQLSFAKAGIPAVTLMSQAWLAQNHTVQDRPEMIQADQLELASKIIYEVVQNLNR